MSLLASALTFAWLALATAYVCTAIREEGAGRVARKTAAFFALIVAGTSLFGLLVALIETLF